MTHSEIKPPHVLFLFSDTGGDHRSAAEAISDAHLDATLVVVTGRSHKLMAQLEAENWSLPTFIYGFTHEMPNFMRTADILLTKAGPGKISEAYIRTSDDSLRLYARSGRW
ncbi:MAG TPA: hypothetical protein DCK95_12810 [Anaerolineaceae bacterium]|jgi:1,2-diacylglycerol 3-beta-galactosyltransferase|uniref:Monogalactosyldiacylglycerol synthase family protein n=1 Tax=Anaerolinea thermophila TaxID=167964 RepID=A0A101FXP8_9CHLR|nr:MAG: Monogalactosyldiacylglycerol synthase family protein [Anaerolinea thermophila]HAF63187.1 hypothetical protein [Anaerolineaceae bacterium]